MSSRSKWFLVLMMFFGPILIALTKGNCNSLHILKKKKISRRLPVVSSSYLTSRVSNLRLANFIQLPEHNT
jgi:hypothetical protein